MRPPVWEAEDASTLEAMGLKRGVSSACAFRNDEKDVVLMVHGGDFFAVGEHDALDQVEDQIRHKYESKTQRLGWERGGAERPEYRGGRPFWTRTA